MKNKGLITTEFWAMIIFISLSLYLFERTWIVLAIDEIVIIAYIFARTKSKETPGVRNYTIHK